MLRSEWNVPLACIFRLTDAARRAAVQDRALADRPESPLAPWRGGDERRRVRDRLVRGVRDAGVVQERGTGLGRRESAGSGASHSLRARVRAHSRFERDVRAANELSPVPARSLALDAQRADSGVPPAPA